MPEDYAGWVALFTTGLVFLQGSLMFVDEFHYHRQRGLGRFERLGHPLDSFCFLFALVIPFSLDPTRTAISVYVVLALVSTLIVTKDEWIHATSCGPAESFIHALLFVVHGPILIGIGFLWILDASLGLLILLPVATLGFAIFQLAYWVVFHDFFAKKSPDRQHILRDAGRSVV